MAGIDVDVKLLLHCNGVDASTDFPDDGWLGTHTITAVGNAQVDTAQKKFGTGSLLGDGAGDYLTIPAHADWNVGSGNFTFDFWQYTSVTDRQCFFGSGIATASHYNLTLQYNTEGDSRKLGLYASSNGSSWDLIDADVAGNGICDSVLPQSQWNHIALVRNSNNWLVFLNGVKDLDITVPGTLFDSSGQLFNIGRNAYNAGTMFLNGWMDEFRFSKGIARWTSNFSVPTEEYSLVAATVNYLKQYRRTRFPGLIHGIDS